MGWSIVSKNHKKPIMWWMHKILCELGWLIRKIDNDSMYLYHLKKCVKYGFNLYGQPFK